MAGDSGGDGGPAPLYHRFRSITYFGMAIAALPSYNSVLQQTGSEQLLTNPVRLRYGDPLYFLDVSSVTTSFEFSGNMAGSASFPGGTASGGVNYKEQPTIIYTPPQGEQFFRQIMSPIELDTLVLLSSPGMPMDRLLPISLHAPNDLTNLPEQGSRAYENFLEAVDLPRRKGGIHSRNPPTRYCCESTRARWRIPVSNG